MNRNEFTGELRKEKCILCKGTFYIHEGRFVYNRVSSHEWHAFHCDFHDVPDSPSTLVGT